MINYTWDIVKLDCYPEAQGKTNVAFTAYFTLTGSDGTYESNGFSSVRLIKNNLVIVCKQHLRWLLYKSRFFRKFILYG